MSTVDYPPTVNSAVLRGISWGTCVALRDSPENFHIRMTYSRGELEIVSPGELHEQYSGLLDSALVKAFRQTVRETA